MCDACRLTYVHVRGSLVEKDNMIPWRGLGLGNIIPRPLFKDYDVLHRFWGWRVVFLGIERA
jgi:hypothetical protein